MTINDAMTANDFPGGAAINPAVVYGAYFSCKSPAPRLYGG